MSYSGVYSDVAKPPSLAALQALVDSVLKGELNDELLRAALTFSPVHIVHANLPARAAFENCTGCKRFTFSAHMHRTYGGKQYVCGECKEKWYTHCGGCNSLILADDSVLHVHARDLVEFMELNMLNHYKANPMDILRPRFLCLTTEKPWINKGVRYFGIEIELEKRLDRPLPPDLIAKSVAAFPRATVLAKTDGSLSKHPDDPNTNGSNGWELCTLPGTLDYHRHSDSGWWKFFQVMKPFVQERPNTTGLHFHVNLDSVAPLVVGKVSAFVNSDCNHKLLVSVADRDFNQPSPTPPHKVYAPAGGVVYTSDVREQLREVHSMRKHDPTCPFHPARKATRMYYYDQRQRGFMYDGHGLPLIIRINSDPTVTYKCNCKKGLYSYKDHYAGLNLKTQKDTFEFRLFRFSMNEQHFFASLEFVDALIAYCTQASMLELTGVKFLKWYNASQRRLYPSLTQWLVDRDWIPSRRRD